MERTIITKKDHLAYYLEHAISPVRQDITDLEKHMQRRGSLYRSIGLPAAFILGKNVLEVGPGSGHNSLYVASSMPKHLVLVEPNPTGRAGISDLYAHFDRPHTVPTIIPEALEEFTTDPIYDVVIAEAWLGVPDHEKSMMRKLSGFVKPGGLLITTATSPVSMLPNILRRILASRIITGLTTIDEQTAVLASAFASHLNTMTAMSRLHVDWIQDTLLNPAFLTGGLTPPALFDILGADFSVYQSYPRLYTDWRWYKELYGNYRDFNGTYETSYFASLHNTVNFRKAYPDRAPGQNRELEELCNDLIYHVSEADNAQKLVDTDFIFDICGRIADNTDTFDSELREAIDEFIGLFGRDHYVPDDIASMEKLKGLFGRELIYLSCIRDR